MVTTGSETSGVTETVSRRRERRRGIGDVLSTLARAIAGRGDPTRLRGAFEESVRQLLSVRAVRLRDANSRWVPAADRSALEFTARDVVGPATASRAVLEAVSDPGKRPGDWELQLLELAAHLAALVLEIERGRSARVRTDAAAEGRVELDASLPLIGSTPSMADLRVRIERVAVTNFTVLLEGESGVGKELVARQIHALSPRRQGPFVAINCAALVETLLEAELFGIEERTATGVRGRRGKFEHADGGTLFLDEVSDLSPSAQAKLLRAIQDLAVERVGGQGAHRVDTRIIAASNRSLAELVARREFRPDLYYRLSGVDVRVPPLRERRPDIRRLALHFLDPHRGARPLKVSDAAMHALTMYDWPGNVRELERLVERAVALTVAETIELEDLPSAVQGDYPEVLAPSLRRSEPLRVWACRYARLVLDRCHGNKREASRVLGISNHTLNAYLRAMRTDATALASHKGDSPASPLAVEPTA